MTPQEQREALVKKALTRKGKNVYTQDARRTQVANGFSDCSAFQQWVEKQVLGIDIGGNTEAQIKSSKLETILVTIKDGIPNESQMLPGDLLYFRGTDNSRSLGVGHVERYIGDNKLIGHGSGIGPTVKEMDDYCRMRFSQKSTPALKNKGLICVRRSTNTDIVQKTGKPLVKKEITKSLTILKGYKGCSVIDAFRSKGLDSDIATRKKYAESVGIKDYKGTQEQNEKLIKLLGGTFKA